MSMTSQDHTAQPLFGLQMSFPHHLVVNEYTVRSLEAC